MFDRLNGIIDYEKLHKKNVIIVGVGGVGAIAFEILVRCGVENITIVDFDTYSLSNLNRQVFSNQENIGKNKVEVLKNEAIKINPNVKVEGICEKLDSNSFLDLTKYDYIIDTCDSVDAKIFLYEKSKTLGIPLISAMGAAKRVDPTKFVISRLEKVTGDPLAKKIREKMKENHKYFNPTVIYSKEVPVKGNILCSYAPVTLTSGILIADKVIKDLIK